MDVNGVLTHSFEKFHRPQSVLVDTTVWKQGLNSNGNSYGITADLEQGYRLLKKRTGETVLQRRETKYLNWSDIPTEVEK